MAAKALDSRVNRACHPFLETIWRGQVKTAEEDLDKQLSLRVREPV